MAGGNGIWAANQLIGILMARYGYPKEDVEKFRNLFTREQAVDAVSFAADLWKLYQWLGSPSSSAPHPGSGPQFGSAKPAWDEFVPENQERRAGAASPPATTLALARPRVELTE